jgi:hypothetical protein
VLKELESDCGSHKPCHGIQDGDATCYYWVAYICGRAGISAKGGVNGGPTMAGLGVATRVCCCRRRCCYYPLESDHGTC